MTGQPDRQVIQCNYTAGTGIASTGARAYVVRLNRGNDNDRIVILVRSRGGRWVEKWENRTRLDNFRVKTLPPGHRLCDRAADWVRPEHASDLLENSNKEAP